MKQVEFSEELGHFIDEEGTKYKGKRVGTILTSSVNHSTYQQAELDALCKLMEIAEKRNADAYEIVDLSRYDSRGPEYYDFGKFNPTPYGARVTALLYKRKN